MRIPKYRNIIVALLMMTFIGQVVAFNNVSCQSSSAPSQSNLQEIDFGMMDHSQHMSLSDSSADNVGPECCPDCDCSVGGCATVALPSAHPIFPSYFTMLSSNYTELAESQLTGSPLRPPITR